MAGGHVCQEGMHERVHAWHFIGCKVAACLILDSSPSNA